MAESIACTVDPGFARWIGRCDGTVVITTYQAGKIVLVGHDGRQVTVLVRDLNVPMGLAIDGPRMAVALKDSIVLFADAPGLAPELPGHPAGTHEHLYLPRVTYVTGDLRSHEIAFSKDGLWFVNTRFNCLSLASVEYSFEPRWMPGFITACVPEDRCHMSGLAMREGAPAYVTAHGESDVEGGWRATKVGGGVVVDVASRKPIVRGLVMPHSPRFALGSLWFLNSGLGELVRVGDAPPERSTAQRSLTTVARLPGFTRGLSFVGHWALIGLSRIRETTVFDGLPVAAQTPELLCGVAVVDTRTGALEGMLRFTQGCEEIFETGYLPGRRRVHLLDPSKPDGKLALSTRDFAYWVRTVPRE